jgi:UPF0755 protein
MKIMYNNREDRKMNNLGMQIGKKRPKRKVKNNYGFLIFLVIVSCIVGITVLGGYLAYNYAMEVSTDKEVVIRPEPDESMEVEIPLGSNTMEIAEILKNMNIIKYTTAFKLLSKIEGYDGTYKAGIHIVSSSMDYNSLKGYRQIMRIIASKPLDNPTIKVTIPEGYTFKNITDVLKEVNLIDVVEFEKAAMSVEFEYKFISGIPEDKKRTYRLEGYLFPDTYIFDKKAEEKEIIKKILDNFNIKFRDEYYARAEELEMTVDEIVTLASIIEKEAVLDEERDRISGVFHNRLKSRDISLRRLESCATIQYIFLNNEGIVKEKILIEDTKIDDPYNTYMYQGLPPGPICCPGEESIKAALYPEKNDYLYFVAKGDGSHVFSDNFRDHVNAMHRYTN